MNKHVVLILGVLAFASLACTMSALQVADVPPAQAVGPAAGLDTPSTATRPSVVCALVTAETAVHLRAGQGSETRILAHLVHGTSVTVMARAGDWWQVVTDGLTGYVNSAYLQETECEQ